jgi:hypothetical protein
VVLESLLPQHYETKKHKDYWSTAIGDDLKVTCDSGSVVNKNKIKYHLVTKKHIKFMEQNL